MRAKTVNGGEIDLKQEAIDGLRMRLLGQLLQPGDAGYEESRTVWNAMIDRKPALVVRCLGVADVIACVRFARDTSSCSASRAEDTTSPAWPRPTAR